MLAVALLVVALAAWGAVSRAPQTATAGGPLRVVVVENFWGSIARQLGGRRAQVTSILVNPNADPHAYEPTIGDARAFASANYVVVNGAGYDSWAQKLLDANPVQGRRVLIVGDFLGIKQGGNPHTWYDPAFVLRVAARMAADYAALNPGGAAYFHRQHESFVGGALRQYRQELAFIARRYHGVPVAATESIFVYLAAALHLSLITPPDFMKALSEGTEPTAQDRSTFERQLAQRQARVLVFNSQNSTPDTQSLQARALSEHIPVVGVTETLSPADASFQDWQVGQLRALRRALQAATGR